MLENYTCSLCGSGSPSVACICNGDINLICSSCKHKHSIEISSNHEALDIHLAIRLQADSNLYEEYLESSNEASQIISRLRIVNAKVKSYKDQLKNDSENLIFQIDSIFKEALHKYDDTANELRDQMKLMTEFKKNLCEKGREVINKYKNERDQGPMSGIVENLRVPVDEIVEFTKNKVRRGHETYKMIRREQEENPDESQELSYYKLYAEDLEIKLKEINKSRFDLQVELARKDAKISKLNQNLKILQESLTKFNTELDSIKSSILEQLHQASLDADRIANHLSSTFNSILSHSSTNLYNLPTIEDNHIEILSSLSDSSYSHPNNFPLVDLGPFTRKFIYTQNVKGCDFIQFDIPNNKLSYITIKNMNAELDYVTICQISKRYLFITGFSAPPTAEAYLYDISTHICTRLKNLPNAKHSISVCYHNKHVYVFGGVRFRAPMKSAYRYHFDGNFWKKLPNMNYEREMISSVVVRDEIYLFAGCYRNIDVFHTKRERYRTLRFDNCETSNSFLSVASLHEDKIYLVTKSFIQAYDINLNKLFTKPIRYTQDRYTCNDKLYHNGRIYYFNNMNQVLEYIDTDPSQVSISLIEEIDPSNHLYKINERTKEIHRIDVKNATIEVFTLESAKCFKCTNLCVLPEGNLFIAGYHFPLNGTCYIYDPRRNTIENIQELDIARGFIGLIYYQYCVYAFGGIGKHSNNMRTAHKFDLRRRYWSRIKDMNLERNLPQCIAIENMIYIIGGGNNSIERYDPYEDCYKFIHHVSLLDSEGVACCIEDKIYYIGNTSYQIFSRDFQEIYREENKWNEIKSIYCLGNSVVHEGKIYYYNQAFETLETFDTRSLYKGVLAIKAT
jgi:hypothetical protein